MGTLIQCAARHGRLTPRHRIEPASRQGAREHEYVDFNPGVISGGQRPRNRTQHLAPAPHRPASAPMYPKWLHQTIGTGRLGKARDLRDSEAHLDPSGQIIGGDGSITGLHSPRRGSHIQAQGKARQRRPARRTALGDTHRSRESPRRAQQGSNYVPQSLGWLALHPAFPVGDSPDPEDPLSRPFRAYAWILSVIPGRRSGTSTASALPWAGFVAPSGRNRLAAHRGTRDVTLTAWERRAKQATACSLDKHSSHLGQDRPQSHQQSLDIVWTSGVAHQADPPDSACQRDQPGTDLDVMFR